MRKAVQIANHAATIQLRGTEYEYSVRASQRARSQKIVVGWDGRLEIVWPKRMVMTDRRVKQLLHKYADWIERHVAKMKNRTDIEPLEHKGVPRQIVERQTREYILSRITHFSSAYRFRPVEIVLRSYRSQWGSCSKTARIGFHYKLCLLPKPLADYVIVHELCHTVHFNHSRSFWGLVETFCPDYRACRKALGQYLL